MVEDQEIDAIVPKACHEQGRKLCPQAEDAYVFIGFVDVDGYVDIAVWLRYTSRVRTEQVGLEYFLAGFQQARDAWRQGLFLRDLFVTASLTLHHFRLFIDYRLRRSRSTELA